MKRINIYIYDTVFYFFCAVAKETSAKMFCVDGEKRENMWWIRCELHFPMCEKSIVEYATLPMCRYLHSKRIHTWTLVY